RRRPRAAVRADRAILGAAAVPCDLAADGRRRTAEAAADGAVGLARRQRARDQFALLERQGALRAGAEARGDAALEADDAVYGAGILGEVGSKLRYATCRG